jgi:hypothetical protein
VSTALNPQLLRLIRQDVQSMHAYAVQDSTGMVKLDAMENPHRLPPELQAELGRRLGALALNRYPGSRVNDLRQALAEYAQVPPGFELMLGNGSDELISLLALACAQPGARVLQMGAGFIGCIIMEALAMRGVQLSVVEMGDRMVPRMMGPTAGGMIKDWCEKKGVAVYTNYTVSGGVADPADMPKDPKELSMDSEEANERVKDVRVNGQKWAERLTNLHSKLQTEIWLYENELPFKRSWLGDLRAMNAALKQQWRTTG